MDNEGTKKTTHLIIAMEHLQDIFENRSEAVNKAICGGLARYADNLRISDETALNTAIYAFLSGQPLPEVVEDFLLGKNVDTMNERTEHFTTSGHFEPDNEILDSLGTIPEPVMTAMVDHAGINLARRNVGISGGESPETILKEAEGLPDGKFFAVIKTDLLLDFAENPKTEFELMQFLVFCGLRSLLGKKSVQKANKDLLFRRIFGNDPTDKEEFLIKKFSSRYQWEKLIHALQLRWHLKYYAYQLRGFFFSFSMELNELIDVAEQNRDSTRIKQLRTLKNELRIAARQKIMDKISSKNMHLK